MRCQLVLLIVFLSTAMLTAQPSGAPPAAAPAGIWLDVVVNPKSGPPVTGLTQQDFTLYDNRTVQPIKSFAAIDGTKTPTHVILVVDAVNIDYQNLALEREQIDKFLLANGGHLTQPTALAFFTDTSTLIDQGFSTDGKALSESLDQHSIGLRNIRRSAQFGGSDRFQLSIKALREIVAKEAGLPGRKLILWVSPGWPLLSGPGIQLTARQQQGIFAEVVDLSARLRQARTTLSSIDPLGTAEGVERIFYYQSFVKGLTKPNDAAVGDLGLQVLAAQSGGLVLTSNNDVAGLLKKAMADTEGYYSLSFEPAVAEHRDEYHSIEIRVSKPNLNVRTRTGYYAQP